MNIINITKQYYSKCLKLTAEDFFDCQGFKYVETKNQDSTVKELSDSFLLFAFLDYNKVIITYNPILNEKIEQVKKLNEKYAIITSLVKVFPKYHLNALYIYTNPIIDIDLVGTRILEVEDLKYYAEYFESLNPMIKIDNLQEKEFFEKCLKQLIIGTFINNKLVCVADISRLPYMEGEIKHISITTLPNERQKGYGKKTAHFASKHLISLGICPQWDHTNINFSAQKLAESIGYRYYGDAFIVKEEEFMKDNIKKEIDYDQIMKEQEHYSKEVEERYGQSNEYKISKQRTSKYNKKDWENIFELQEKNLDNLVKCYIEKRNFDDEKLLEVVEEAQRIIDKFFYPCSIEMMSNLGMMYINDERFKKFYEKRAIGLARYYNDAIQFYVTKNN